MLAFALAVLLGGFLLAGFIDWRDSRRGRSRRRTADMLADRVDLERDMAATQHRGIFVPIGDICRDRQRGR